MYNACDICSREFNYPSLLKMHYRSHTGEKPFHCKFCSKSFSHEAHLIVHNQIHSQKKEYKCEVSDKTDLQKSALKEHTELHKDDRKSKPCVAEDFCSENGLDRQNVILKLYKCVICREVFSKECDLKCHFLSHKDENPFLGDKKCDETVSIKSKLSVLSRTRKKQRPFICDACGEVFSKEENFLTHKRECSKCDKLFFRKNKLNFHHRVHTDEKLFKRGKLFSAERNFKMHKLGLTENKPFECDICFKLFSREGNLNRHRLVHTNESFQCDVCGKLFYSMDKLNLHRPVHSNEKPFECDICDKLFSRRDKLNLHCRVHTDEKPFMCDTCGKLFSRKDKLKLHYRVHIKTEPLCVMDAVKHLR